MSSVYGESLKLCIFGQSHGKAIGMTLDGIPAGLSVDTAALQLFLNRRAPGQNDWSTPRKEEDQPEFLSGLVNNITCGAPITAIICNNNTRSGDYENLKDQPRPGHADYTAQIKYGGYQDVAGGGHFSGRLTAALCIAGGMCKQWLDNMGVHIHAHILSVGDVQDDTFDALAPQSVSEGFPVINTAKGQQMIQRITDTRARNDSIGGTIECAVTGLPAGLGDPMFGGAENRISQIIFGIPAVKGLQFGDTKTYGSQNNDSYRIENGKITTATNHCGGILGGITNGMPLIFRVQMKPTPSIGMQQETVSISGLESVKLEVKGRHDPCIVPRAVPVVEAAAAIAVFDMILSRSDRRI